MDAVVNNDIEKLRTFLDNVDIGRADYDNRSLLHIACSEGHIEIIELLKISPDTCSKEHVTTLNKILKN